MQAGISGARNQDLSISVRPGRCSMDRAMPESVVLAVGDQIDRAMPESVALAVGDQID